VGKKKKKKNKSNDVLSHFSSYLSFRFHLIFIFFFYFFFFFFFFPVYHKIDFSEMKPDKNTEKRLYVKDNDNKHQKQK
jgi:quinol-cytochrome oxidoreductase complex cytochrome b subunit